MSTPYTEAASSRFVRVRDGEVEYNVHYNDVGPASGQVIVMLHGSGPGATGWANFHRNVESFAGAGYRVLLIDMPGFGKSDVFLNTAGSRSDFNGRIVKLVLDRINVERAHLVGNSMGGHSSMAFALASPGRVGKLVLMGGGTGGPSQFVPMPTEGIKLLNHVYREPTLENVKRMMNVFVFDASALTDDLLQLRVENMLTRRDHLENWVKSLAANPKQFSDYGTRLGEVKAPALIIWGRDDRFVPFDIGLRLLWGMPNAEMHIFNRCGHWAQWEHADKFNRMVLAFLAE
ncbi:alpha/beta fold hydrolase [Massilia sp. NEAU-DD11]|uniref:Alpha/beta fold hydrolase n=1 Tax=Massilia cellulosiltytica TaxID=2683234 RepID=A0A7X3K8H9_9BURK|nr:alpha/beta fold hydrolase [Telluria cellulosilytica]MVW61517.1 alpha/beta fold hydrolase [Telluria cellulosilytica]